MTLHVPIEVEQLARLVAMKTGKTPDDVLRDAVEAHALSVGLPRRRPFDEAKVRAIIARVAALPLLDTRTDDEILGYNEHGVWD